MRPHVTPINSALPARCLGSLVLAGALISGCATSTNAPEAETTSTLTQTIYSDDGVSEVSVPADWTVRPDFGRDAALRVAEDSGKAFLLLNTYQPGEIPDTTAADFSRSYAQGLVHSLPNSAARDEVILEINGAPAHRHVVSGDVGNIRLTYVSTVMQGDTALHHLIAWTAASDYQRNGDVLDDVISSFRESQTQRIPRQRIGLSFDWPDSFQSAANFRQTSVRRGKKSELKATYLTTVSPGDDNELYVRTRVMSHNTHTGQSAAADLTRSLARHLTAEVPDYVVSRDGEFIRIVNLPAYQQRVETALVSSLPPDETGQKEKILALLQPGLTEQYLAAAATNEWNKTVGGWVGSSYVPGRTYRFNETYYSPPLGDTPFVMNVSRQVPGFTRCNSANPDCVQLLQTARVDGADFRSAMRRFLENAMGKEVRLKEISVVKNMEIIAEPGTLIPHRIRASEETTVVIEDAAGNLHTSRDVEETHITYNYESYTASR